MTQGSRTLWQRLTRFNLGRSRLTRRRLDAFVAAHASDGPALVVHSHDVDHIRHFPKAFHVSSRAEAKPGLLADRHYTVLADLPADSRDVIVCTGLLEHLPDPGAAVRQFGRILKPGGKLVLSASGVFSYHGAPENYFHFTPGGFKVLFGEDLDVVTMSGTTRPFETLAVLAQRINLQCDVAPPVRLFVELLIRGLPLLDVFVLRQYASPSRGTEIDPTVGIMPATLLAVATKREPTP
jgi:SAM-dependent methyltransferase